MQRGQELRKEHGPAFPTTDIGGSELFPIIWEANSFPIEAMPIEKEYPTTSSLKEHSNMRTHSLHMHTHTNTHI